MKAKRYNVSVGLNDSYSKTQEEILDDVIAVMEHFFSRYKIDFSLSKINGGYSYKDGEYTHENSIVFCFITTEMVEIERFINTIKMALHQETVLLEVQDIEVEFI